MMNNRPALGEAKRNWLIREQVFLGELNLEDNLPVVWFSNIRPTQPHKWLQHILLSMGRFDNEYNLLRDGSMKSAFIRAKLFQDTNDEQELESAVHSVLRRYVLEQLVYLPGGSRQFDRYLAGAYHALRECFLHDDMATQELPPSLYTKIHSTTDKKTKKHMLDMRIQLVRALLSDFFFQTHLCPSH